MNVILVVTCIDTNEYTKMIRLRNSICKVVLILRRIMQLLFLVCLFHSTTEAQNTMTFTVGSIEAKSGEKVSGSLVIEEGVDQGTFIPITVINGKNPGPVLTLVAGIHGTEYVPILALQQLVNEIDPSGLSGKVILVHIANMPSYKGRAVYLSPIDHKNLNRVFPGKKNGTVTERIAYTLTHEIINKSDYYIDMHGGEFSEALVDFLYFQSGCPGDDLCEKSRKLAEAMGNNYLLPDPYELVTDTSLDCWSALAAIRNNIPAISVEFGDRGKTEQEEIGLAKRGAINVMRAIGMLEGEVIHNDHPLYLYDDTSLLSNHTGIFFSTVEEGQYIPEGKLIGYTTDYWGHVLEEFHSPASGIVTIIIKIPVINKGESVCQVNRVSEKFEE